MKRLRYSGFVSTDTGDNVSEDTKQDRSSIYHSSIAVILRLLFIFSLIMAIIIEGYYIFVMRERINKQTEELKNNSFQLQKLKNERDYLHEKIFLLEKQPGDKSNGNTTQR